MKCSKCGAENRTAANFCIECGNKLILTCTRCEHFNLPGSKFCEKCGFNLVEEAGPVSRELSYDEKLRNIQKYLPEGLREKILSQKDRIEGERKQVTVVFADMEGFTGLLDQLGIEEAYSVMDKVYEILIHKVHDFEGVVNEMTGDGIMALFGAPVALEDAPQKAIRTAYSIHKEMAKFSERMQRKLGRSISIKMRIGIHTGPVVVGTLGNDFRLEFKAVGDTVNLASRMEGLAKAGTTYVSEETFKLTEGFFRFEALGEKKIKGKKEPVKIYRFIAPGTRRTRFDVSAERGLTPFVGRDQDLDLLLDGYERARAGNGQAFSIVAEAGGGKSRLLYEFRKAVSNENANFLEGKCLSYSRNIAYQPVIDILQSIFNIAENDDEGEIKAKAAMALEILEIDAASALPYLLELLSVKESGIDAIPMSTEARKDRTLEALKQVVLRYAAQRPLILAIEDLHWIDQSSEGFLENLLQYVGSEKILLIFNYRPKYVCSWSKESCHCRIQLNRLSRQDSLQMVYHILGTRALEAALEQLSLEKTEGIPFFIEEFVRSLKDLRLAEKKAERYCLAKDFQEMTVPSTIQDIIMARVDALPKGAKDILQTGSVIEREFSFPLIRQVTNITEQDLLSHLEVLKDNDLLYERGVFPESSYIFKHALTRNVLYDSILTRKRQNLHEIIGNAIEVLFKDNPEKHYGVLTEHFIASGNYKKGALYSRLAERYAEKAASLSDAMDYAQKRIDCLGKLPPTDNVQKEIIDARTILGLYAVQSGFHTQANKAVEPVVELAEKLDYQRRLPQIYSIIGSYKYIVEEDFPAAFRNLEEALSISGKSNDMVSSLFSNFWLGVVRSVNCEFERAHVNMTRALEINRAANSNWGVSIIKSNFSFFIHYFNGNIKESFQTSKEAHEGANESGDIFSKAMASVCHGFSCYGRGFFDEAIFYLGEGCKLCDKINLVIFHGLAHFWMGEAFYELGNLKDAEDNYRQAITILEHNQIIPSWVNVIRSARIRMQAVSKKPEIDLDRLIRYADGNRSRIWDGWLNRNIAEIMLFLDHQHLASAEDWINKAINADSTNGTRLNLGRSFTLYARLYRRRGQQDDAVTALNTAIEIFKKCGSSGFLKQAEDELASIG